MPKRIQRQRVKGWRMPAGAVYVGRPGVLGNPFNGFGAIPVYRHWLRMGDKTAQEVFDDCKNAYRGLKIVGNHQLTGSGVAKCLPDLRGKDLACWCPKTKQCHADVLLTLANQ